MQGVWKWILPLAAASLTACASDGPPKSTNVRVEVANESRGEVRVDVLQTPRNFTSRGVARFAPGEDGAFGLLIDRSRVNELTVILQGGGPSDSFPCPRYTLPPRSRVELHVELVAGPAGAQCRLVAED